ncbi:hypothetical protein [uncultured Tenacibaculum sp.]|uniref:hypothetical protein n=1 Tax=uncultured Tenacibaculum sp. TaxID=174713 RepID=UPI00260562F0|nr:hypothetical protein [uncultured Tenacibaculum sp.]
MEKLLEILEKLNKVIDSVSIDSETLRKGTEKLEKAYEKLKKVLTSVYDKFIQLKDKLKENISNKLDKVKTTFFKIKGAIDKVKSGIQGAIFKVKSFVSKVKNGFNKVKSILDLLKGYIKQGIGIYFGIKPINDFIGKLRLFTRFFILLSANANKAFNPIIKTFSVLRKLTNISNLKTVQVLRKFATTLIGLARKSRNLFKVFTLLSVTGGKFRKVFGVVSNILNIANRFFRTSVILVRKLSNGIRVTMNFFSVLATRIALVSVRLRKFFRGIGATLNKIKFLAQLNPLIKILLYVPLAINLFKKFKSNLEPIIGSLTYLAERLNNFINAMFPLQEGGYLFEWIKFILEGLGVVLSYISLGLSIVFETLKPIAPVIGMIATVWALWNAIMYLSPLTWLIIGIVAVVAAIAILIKYTKGWGTAWQGLGDMLSAIWQQIKSDFWFLIDSIGYGFKLAFLNIVSFGQRAVQFVKNIGQAIKLAWQGKFSEARETLTQKIETKAQVQIEELKKNRDQRVKQYQLDFLNNAKTFGEGLKKVQSLSFDGKGLQRDISKVKNNFSFSADKTGNETPSLSTIPSGTQQGIGNITDGGKKQTNINVHFDKLIEQMNITTEQFVEGVDEMEDKVKEALLRVLNSTYEIQI